MAKVSVGIILPKKSPSGDNVYELCQDEKCVEAGSLASFGDSSNAALYKGPNPPPINKETYSIRDTDVTATIIAQSWSLEKLLVARMKTCVVGCDNVPEPVVIYHKLSNDGQIDEKLTRITLNPMEKVEKYGNLIEDYVVDLDLINTLKNNRAEPGPGPGPEPGHKNTKNLGENITKNIKNNVKDLGNLGDKIKNNMKV